MKALRITMIVFVSLAAFTCRAGSAWAEHTIALLNSTDWPPHLRQVVEQYFLTEPEGRAFLSENNRERRENHQEVISDQGAIDSLTAAFGDLNDDGVDELFIGMSAYFGLCGTGGCDVKIFIRANDKWRPLGDVYDSSDKLTILDNETGGMHDIRSLYLEKGIEHPYTEKWDGKEYP